MTTTTPAAVSLSVPMPRTARKLRLGALTAMVVGSKVGSVIHDAYVLDRNSVLAAIRHLHPGLRDAFADGGYAGNMPRAALARTGNWTIQIVKRIARH